MHFSHIDVHEGQKVTTGQLLGVGIAAPVDTPNVIKRGIRPAIVGRMVPGFADSGLLDFGGAIGKA